MDTNKTAVPISADSETEPKILIDSDLRIISIPEIFKNIGVVGDHYAETVYFQIPKLFDDVDLSTKTIQIWFLNAAKYKGISEAIDVTFDDSNLYFGWEIDRRVTAKSGQVSFGIYFTDMEGRGYQLGTTAATVSVLQGLNDGEIIQDQDNSTMIQILMRLSNLEQTLSPLQSEIENLRSGNADVRNSLNLLSDKINAVDNELTDLKSNVVYHSIT